MKSWKIKVVRQSLGIFYFPTNVCVYPPSIVTFIIAPHFRVPTDLEKSGRAGEKIVVRKSHGKVREYCFLSKSQGHVNFKCRLPWKFAVIVFKCYISSIKYNTDIIWNELFQTIPGIRLICLHTIWIDNQLSIKWSGKFLWKTGKS